MSDLLSYWTECVPSPPHRHRFAWVWFAQWLEREFPLTVESAHAGSILRNDSRTWLVVKLRRPSR